MSRTINTMPLDVQRLDAAGLRAPHDIGFVRSHPHPYFHRAAYEAWARRRDEALEEADELDPTFWQTGYGGAWPGRKGWARLLNRRYRAQVKDNIRHHDYERIDPPKREAAWLIW